MSYEQIRYEVRDGVCILTLNRPERMNAWTGQMSEELSDAITQCNDDPAIGAIIITVAVYYLSRLLRRR